jgi:hypothetical protein
MSDSIGSDTVGAGHSLSPQVAYAGRRSPKLGTLFHATLGLLIFVGQMTVGATVLACDIAESADPVEQGAATIIDSNGEIEGQVTIGPGCPAPTGPDPECGARLTALTVSILDEHGQPVQQVRPDSDGRFRVALSPGLYVLHPELGPWINAREQTAVVTSWQVTQVRIVYESGVR